jgi:hypothetical protein
MNQDDRDRYDDQPRRYVSRAAEARLMLELDADAAKERRGTDAEIKGMTMLTTETIKTDREILDEVCDAIDRANASGGNWADGLPGYVECEDRYRDDAWYVGTLGDGRTIWLCDESATGSYRYRIVAPE